MHLTELVLQGVRRFNQPKKLTFQPGFNVILGDAGSGKTTLSEIVLHLFFPQKDYAIFLEKFLTKNPSGPCRAGMSFEHKKEIYRNVMDFTQGAANLSKFNGNDSTYKTILAHPEQIDAFFKNELKIPEKEVYQILFLTTAEEFPSKNQLSQPSLSGISAGSSLSQNPQALKRELQSLYKLQQDALKIKEMQYKLDGMHKEIFELADILKRSEKIEEKMATIRNDIKQFGKLPEIPEDLEERIGTFDRLAKKRSMELPAMEQEVHDREQEVRFAHPLPLVKDVNFLIGCGFLVGVILVGLVTGTSEKVINIPVEYFRYLLLAVGLLGLILSALRLSAFFSAKEGFENLEKEIRLGREKIRKYERKFEVETTVVRNMMKSLSVESTQEMVANISKIKNGLEQIAQLEKQLEMERAKPEFEKAHKGLPEMKKKAAEVEAELQILSSTPLDAQALGEQIAQLEGQAQRLGADLGVQGGQNVGALHPEISEAFIRKIGREFYYHPTHKMIAITAYAVEIPLPDFLVKLIPPLGKNLSAFSFKNLSDPNIEMDGTFSIQDVEINSRVRFEQLEGFKQDLVYFALKFTLLQFLLREKPFPVVFDAPFQSFDERMSDVIAKSIKFLSQQNQIIFLTSRPQYAQAADVSQKL